MGLRRARSVSRGVRADGRVVAIKVLKPEAAAKIAKNKTTAAPVAMPAMAPVLSDGTMSIGAPRIYVEDQAYPYETGNCRGPTIRYKGYWDSCNGHYA